ncbi:hypothetical protein QJS04_geneDACA005328 [Acorus gramineus]|uniref:Uncharacterized protein n=1 Tax=Acorus gramineus TaxID=55184 RepID=A0AAV9AWG2_ACOGR|nr:hypothetical protein QJS04_geneDACA005328 [Acorus gramineus]
MALMSKNNPVNHHGLLSSNGPTNQNGLAEEDKKPADQSGHINLKVKGQLKDTVMTDRDTSLRNPDIALGHDRLNVGQPYYDLLSSKLNELALFRRFTLSSFDPSVRSSLSTTHPAVLVKSMPSPIAPSPPSGPPPPPTPSPPYITYIQTDLTDPSNPLMNPDVLLPKRRELVSVTRDWRGLQCLLCTRKCMEVVMAGEEAVQERSEEERVVRRKRAR